MTTPLCPSPLEFFSHLAWIDGRPLPDVIERYRTDLFMRALYTFGDDGAPVYDLVLAGRGKKNWKSADLILAALYRFLVWPSPLGNDCFLVANDEGQAADDLKLAKKLVSTNPLLGREVEVRAKELVRCDGKGALAILPARDVIGAHGKTYTLVGFDELHGHRTWDLLEALAPDPTRPDALTWITSYASIYNAPGAPLYDLFAAGKQGDDLRMLFSWYAADYGTDPDFADLPEPEQRANPSMESWGNPGYLEQQRRRLPTHKYRRLHLNLPGAPEGAFYDGGKVMAAIIAGRRQLAPQDGVSYLAFVDMSGGSGDDATLGIAHAEDGRRVLDLVTAQTGRAPFNPRDAVTKFAGVLERYGVATVTGDRYAGETFRADFEDKGVRYVPCGLPKSQLYEALEPPLNAGEIELLDVPKLQEQLLTLVMRGAKIDHQPGDHDDWANAAAGALWLVGESLRPRAVPWRPVNWAAA